MSAYLFITSLFVMAQADCVVYRTNPILLIVTALVSVLHMVFEFLGTFESSICERIPSDMLPFDLLAFAADVGHWRKKNEFTGVSVRFELMLS